MQAFIAGGDTVASRAVEFVLDGSATYDPDDAKCGDSCSQFVYEWSCQTNEDPPTSCYEDAAVGYGAGVTIGTSVVETIPAEQLKLAPSADNDELRLIFTLAVTKDPTLRYPSITGFASAQAEITVVSGQVPKCEIGPRDRIALPQDALVLMGSSLQTPDVGVLTYRWYEEEFENTGVGLDIAALTDLPLGFQTEGDGIAATLSAPMKIGGDQLAEGSEYKFVLHVTETTSFGTSECITSTSIYINEAPSGGTAVVSPTTGVMMAEEYQAEFAGWLDEQLPLSYSVQLLGEECVATDAAICEAVVLDGTATACESSGSCTYTPETEAYEEACVAIAAETCAAVVNDGTETTCTGAGDCAYNPTSAYIQTPSTFNVLTFKLSRVGTLTLILEVADSYGSGVQQGVSIESLPGEYSDDTAASDIAKSKAAGDTQALMTTAAAKTAPEQETEADATSEEGRRLQITRSLQDSQCIVCDITTALAEALASSMLAESDVSQYLSTLKGLAETPEASLPSNTAVDTEQCVATDTTAADACSAASLVDTCTGQLTSDDTTDCASVAAFVSDPVEANCPTNDGCTFTAVGETACTGAGACAYTPDDDGTADVNEESCDHVCSGVTNDGTEETCTGAGACTYTPPSTLVQMLSTFESVVVAGRNLGMSEEIAVQALEVAEAFSAEAITATCSDSSDAASKTNSRAMFASQLQLEDIAHGLLSSMLVNEAPKTIAVGSGDARLAVVVQRHETSASGSYTSAGSSPITLGMSGIADGAVGGTVDTTTTYFDAVHATQGSAAFCDLDEASLISSVERISFYGAETCTATVVGEDDDICAAVVNDGTEATCTSAGACTYTPAYSPLQISTPITVALSLYTELPSGFTMQCMRWDRDADSWTCDPSNGVCAIETQSVVGTVVTCGLGALYPDQILGVVKKPWTVCTVDQYEYQAPSATQDRVCLSHPECAEDQGQYISKAATPTTPRECADVTTCSDASGLVVGQPSTATSDNVCECAAGYFTAPAPTGCTYADVGTSTCTVPICDDFTPGSDSSCTDTTGCAYTAPVVAVVEACVASATAACSAVSLVDTCTGQIASDSTDCASVAAFVSDPVEANCPTSDGCTFTAVGETACTGAGACAYTPDDDGTADVIEETCVATDAAACSGVTNDGTSTFATTCFEAGACTHVPASHCSG